MRPCPAESIAASPRRGRNLPGHRLQDRGAKADAQRPTNDREHQALGEQLPDNTSALGAERGPHGDLTRPPRRSRQQQTGNIRAAQEQHEAQNAQQEDRRRLQIASDDAGANRFNDDGSAPVRFGMLARESVGNHAELRLRGLQRHTRLQARDDVEGTDGPGDCGIPGLAASSQRGLVPGHSGAIAADLAHRCRVGRMNLFRSAPSSPYANLQASA
jgi:hypothetical protein